MMRTIDLRKSAREENPGEGLRVIFGEDEECIDSRDGYNHFSIYADLDEVQLWKRDIPVLIEALQTIYNQGSDL